MADVVPRCCSCRSTTDGKHKGEEQSCSSVIVCEFATELLLLPLPLISPRRCRLNTHNAQKFTLKRFSSQGGWRVCWDSRKEGG